ncbi:MAG: isoaspartyl peptidase/L-asparaginase family protein [Bacteroidia bacterium]
MKNPIAIAIHGGAGTILKKMLTPELEAEYTFALKEAVNLGYQVLKQGGTSLDAVESSVVYLENCYLFNAGKGAVFNALGQHEMDASIMEGQHLRAGAVSSVQNIKNPVKLARAVMDQSEHVFLTASGALEFAKAKHIEMADDDYFFVQNRYDQWQSVKDTDQYNLDHVAKLNDKKFGTVGAVALDSFGNLAAATSTGGMTNKKYGRVGDSPIIGAGTYANNTTCAISCTGHGELFIRSVVAYDISCLMEYKGLSLKQACDIVVYDKLVNIKGEGGLVALDKSGNIELPFNSEGMYRASINSKGEVFVEIYK